ncbi:MAG: DUF642 domain-containing protein [Bryobacteraceae bacterium]|jgi:hypothetical protein
MKRRDTLKSLLQSAVLLALACGVAIPANANIVTNGTFSGTILQNGGQYSEFDTGQTFTTGGAWTVINGVNSTGTSGSVDWIGTYWTNPPGSQSVDLDGATAGGIEQALTTTPNAFYTVTFDFSANPEGTNLAGYNAVKTLYVMAGDITDPLTWNTVTEGNTTGNMKWTVESFTFQAQASSTMLKFISGDAFDSHTGPAVADISVDLVNTTPEPGLYGALAIGLAGLSYALIRRRRA